MVLTQQWVLSSSKEYLNGIIAHSNASTSTLDGWKC
jgi:hypothetical protein